MNKENTQDRIEKLEQQFTEYQHKVDTLESVFTVAKEVLTLEEAAVFMGISRSTLYKMTHEQVIPFYKPNGKLIYFEKTELLKWIRKNRVASESEIEAQAKLKLQELALRK